MEKTIRVAVVSTSDAPCLTTIPNTLEDLKALIKCEWMESLYVSIGGISNFYLLFDEEGKINGHSDVITCFLMGKGGAPVDFILGNVVIVRFDGEEDFVSLSRDDYSLISDWLSDVRMLKRPTFGRFKIADRYLYAQAPIAEN